MTFVDRRGMSLSMSELLVLLVRLDLQISAFYSLAFKRQNDSPYFGAV